MSVTTGQELYRLPSVRHSGLLVGLGTSARGSRLSGLATAGDIFTFCEAREMLGALKEGRIQAAVRGELPARPFLEAVREVLGVKKVFRVALLSTAKGRPFLFAPVGIEAVNIPGEQVKLVRYGRSLLRELGWPDRVGLLAGGRQEDRGRSKRVDEGISRAERVASLTGATLRYVLIEEAAARDRLIIAPDGISGNLIYRTLVHLGGGRSHGAVYFPTDLVVVDTSRAAPLQEYREAVKLARLLAAARIGAAVPLPLK